MVNLPVLGLIGVRMVIEIQTFCRQFFQGGFGFAAGVKFLQYTAVTLQDIVNIPNQVITAAVQLVVVIIAALVIAEFFVSAAV